MRLRFSVRYVVRAWAAPVAAVALASCGGGSSPAVATAPGATPSPTPPPTTASATLAIQSDGAAALPTLDGLAATLAFGTPIPAGTTLSATESLSAPAGAAQPTASRRARSVPGAVPFFFVRFTLSTSFPVSAFTGEAVTLTSAQPGNAAYFAELDDVTSASVPVLSRCGPATVTSSVATIDNATCVPHATTTLLSTHTYLLQFYDVLAGSPSPSPTPHPTATPSAIPSASPSATPTASASPAIAEYALSPSDGLPTGITSGADGNLWIAMSNAPAIDRVTTSGGVTTYPQPTLAIPAGIVLGPDGNVYFTATGGRFIGQITPAGVTTEFAIPNGATPYAIAAGDGDTLWFTESQQSGAATVPGVETVTTAGAFESTFALPTSSATFRTGQGIVKGPDGAMWFTEPTPGKIGRITASGEITEFTAGLSGGAYPCGIAVGPDGALWFTETNLGKIGRITTSGTISEYPLPAATGAPFGIVAGRDGALWFTENAANKIGRITIGGAVTELAVPTAGSHPWGITVGPDQHIWFTEQSAGKVGRVR